MKLYNVRMSLQQIYLYLIFHEVIHAYFYPGEGYSLNDTVTFQVFIDV
jgi:hypothetical protein